MELRRAPGLPTDVRQLEARAPRGAGSLPREGGRGRRFVQTAQCL